MSSRQHPDEAVRRVADGPVVWFALFEHGRRAGDDDLVRQARQELLRCGYCVRLARKCRPRP